MTQVEHAFILAIPEPAPAIVRPGLLEEITSELAEHGIEPKPLSILRHALERGIEPDLALLVAECAERREAEEQQS